jgi:hypothetical protein
MRMSGQVLGSAGGAGGCSEPGAARAHPLQVRCTDQRLAGLRVGPRLRWLVWRVGGNGRHTCLCALFRKLVYLLVVIDISVCWGLNRTFELI